MADSPDSMATRADSLLAAVVTGVGFGLMALGLVRLYERRQDTECMEDTDDPPETLRERYARGELSKAEFERQVEQLLETEPADGTAERVTERSRERDTSRRDYPSQDAVRSSMTVY